MTDALKSTENELTVQVRDYSDAFYYSRGKQKIKRGGMFYTAQSGIWQTVWMEQVPENYIADLSVTPLYDESAVRVKVRTVSHPHDKGQGERNAGEFAITISSSEMQPVQAEGVAGKELVIPVFSRLNLDII